MGTAPFSHEPKPGITPAGSKSSVWLRHAWLLHLLLISAVGVIAYANTFHVPFVWDDGEFIANNPAMSDLSYFLDLSKAHGTEFYSALARRYVGYLSFALNYQIHGLDVRGYHAINVAIHIANALLVYLLVVFTFRTPFLGQSPLGAHADGLALFCALIFVSHPVHTEAVTYIFQRLASLMTFFYLLSLVAYVRCGLSGSGLGGRALYVLSLVSAVLAMKTKENAFTLPVVITLYEFLFFRSCRRGEDPDAAYLPKIKKLLTPFPMRILPFLFTLLIIPVSLTGLDVSPAEIVDSIDGMSRGATDISRWDYLLTQFRVGVTYVRLLFYPVKQNFDYDYPIHNEFFSPDVFLSLLFLLSIFALGMYLLYRSEVREAMLRLVAFGVFWFFIALSVESSLVPLPTLASEYRLYLPSVGAFLAVASGLFILKGRGGGMKVQAAIVLMPLLLLYATHARNSDYENRVSLWKDTAEKSPYKARAQYNLAVAYAEEGLYEKAVEHYHIALSLEPDCSDSHFNLGVIHAQAGNMQDAIEHYTAAVDLDPLDPDAHNNLGAAYAAAGMVDMCIDHCQKAVRLKPAFPEAHFNLGLAYLEKGLLKEARGSFERTLRVKPNHFEAMKYLSRLVRAGTHSPGG